MRQLSVQERAGAAAAANVSYRFKKSAELLYYVRIQYPSCFSSWSVWWITFGSQPRPAAAGGYTDGCTLLQEGFELRPRGPAALPASDIADGIATWILLTASIDQANEPLVHGVHCIERSSVRVLWQSGQPHGDASHGFGRAAHLVNR